MATRLIDVNSPSHPKLIDTLRDLSECVAGVQFSPAVAQRVGLATHELVDNAIRFGSLRSDIEYQLSFDPATAHLFVQATNTALPSRIGLLLAHVERVRRLPMTDLMRPSPPARSGPQLGLARIRHEAGLDLRVEIRSDRVIVIATGRI